MNTTVLNWISNWYQEQCNGEWEHSFGIKIGTIDNPGWEVNIDIEETNYVGKYGI